jgi:hypothetical protein
MPDTSERNGLALPLAADGGQTFYSGLHTNFETIDAALAKCNFAGGATPPDADNDVGEGYAIGSKWHTDTAIWICTDATEGAAVWRQIWPALGTDMDLTAYIPKSFVDAKGDLISASADNTPARVGIGANGTVPIADSTQTCGFSWAELMTEGVYRQLLINGAFQINQRALATYTAATSPANSDDTYLLDQWTLLSDGNDVVDVSPAAAVAGIANSVKLEVETANKKFGLIQFVESKDALKYAGKAASLQFKAYTVTGKVIRNLRAAVLSWASTADTITSDVVNAWSNEGTNPTLVANWTAENAAANCALVADTWTTYRIENISIDTANMTNLAVFIWCDDADAAVDDLVYISQVQLNQGPVCTPCMPRCFEDELIRCKKYYQTSYNYGTAPGAATGTGFAMFGFVMNAEWITCLHVASPAMRPITYIQTYHSDGTANSVSEGVSSTKHTTVIYSEHGTRGCRNVYKSGGSFTTGEFINAHWVFSSEL